MTTTMDQLVEALRFTADQQAQLGAMLLAAQEQHKATGGDGNKEKDTWADLGRGEITVDSAADESSWPNRQGDAFKTKPSSRKIILKTGNGDEVGHYGGEGHHLQEWRRCGRPEVSGDGCSEAALGSTAAGREGERGAVRPGAEAELHYGRPDRQADRHGERTGSSFVIAASFVQKLESQPGFPRQAR